MTTRTTGTGPADRPLDPLGANAGWFAGYVNDSTDRLGVSGALVSPVSATTCPAGACLLNVTGGTGRFLVGCGAPGGIGDDYTLQVTGPPWYDNNASYDVCSPGNTTWVGTIYLVRQGIARGVLLDAASLLPVPDVTVTSVSRDGLVAGSSPNISDAHGAFVLAVPPEPSRISFSPPAGYLPTFNYTNTTPGTGIRPGAPPWTNPVDLGTIYLTRMTLVHARLVDAITGLPVGSNSGAAIQACDGATGACQIEGSFNTSGDVSAFAAPGPTYFRVDALGFQETYTETRTVPEEPAGVPYDYGDLVVTPDGAFELESNLSTPAGGTPPGGGTGAIVVTACSLDGLEFPRLLPSLNFTDAACLPVACTSPASLTLVYALPFRDAITVRPDTGGVCGWWSMPPDVPAAGTAVTVNLTAGHVLPFVVRANLTVGDYVAGRVLDASTHAAPSDCFQVRDFSTDTSEIDLGGSAWDSCAGNLTAEFAPCAALATRLSGSFCAPVLPGASRLEVSSPSYATNWTWVAVGRYCCRTGGSTAGFPTTLAAATGDHAATINLTPLLGNVSGWAIVGANGSTPLSENFSVLACSVVDPTLTCGASYGGNGRFTAAGAPAGLDSVTLSARGYRDETVWVNVTPGRTVSAGTVPLEPYGTISGRVVDPTGNGLYTASVTYCPVDRASACYFGAGLDLGLGVTALDGTFNGTVPGGWLPWATYVVAVSAAGYSTDWAFANVTSGGFTRIPTLTLYPLGVSARPAAPAPLAPASVGVWVTGRLLDSITGAAVDHGGGLSLQACPISGSGNCGGFPDGINQEGFFNGSLTPGLYNLDISAPGYVAASIFLNATGRGSVAMGNIDLTADDWLSGQTAIDPWASITVHPGSGFGSGYGPPGYAVACNAKGVDCQLGLPFDQDGRFNVTAPPGSAALLRVEPTPGAFLPNATLVSLTGPFGSGPSASLLLAIDGILGGRVLDGSSGVVAGSGKPLRGLPGAWAEFTSTGPNGNVSDGVVTDADGVWVTQVPPDNGADANRVYAYATPGYGQTTAVTVVPNVPPGAAGVVDLSFTLDRYGWIVARLADAGSGAPIVDTGVAASGTDPGSGGSVSVSDKSNGAGVVNVSAPPGTGDNLTIQGGVANRTVVLAPEVFVGSTTFVNGSGYGSLRPVPVDTFGFVRSPELTYSSGPPPLKRAPPPGLIDAVTKGGLPLAQAIVVSNDLRVAPGVSSLSDSDGLFVVDAPIGHADALQITAGGYVPKRVGLGVAPGAYLVESALPLTGDAVVAGRVVSRFNGTPVVGATVALCGPVTANTTRCQYAETNQSGVFWGTVDPGADQIWINASGYVSNVTSIDSCSDCWESIGTVRASPDGGVDGTVLGLPSGDPLANATVGLCPLALFSGRPCSLNVSTDTQGRFFLPVAPGSYELDAFASGYNSSFFPIDIAVGEIVDVGNLFLEIYGNATGQVVDATTGAAIANASIYACPDWSGGSCAPTVSTDAVGDYRVAAPPGPYTIGASAPNYQLGSVAGVIDSAGTNPFPILRLYPIGDNTPLTLTGRVVNALDPSQGVALATVAADVRAAVQYSTLTNGSGGFTLKVDFGTYLLVATKSGDAPAEATIFANASRSGIVLELGPQLYPVLGTATDGLTGTPVAGVAIEGPVPSNGSTAGLPVIATSAPDGTFTFTLPDGTFDLQAVAPPGPIRYLVDDLSVRINGARAFQNLSLVPGQEPFAVTVLDAGTGFPIDGASVTLTGTPEPGYVYRQPFLSGADGKVALPLYDATYLVVVSAPGYASAQRVELVQSGPVNLTVRLTPLAGAASGGGGFLGLSTPDLAAIAALGIAAVAALLIIERGRRRHAKLHPEEPMVAPDELYPPGPPETDPDDDG